MQNLQKADKNAGPIFRRLWTKVHKFLALFAAPFPIVYTMLRFENVRR